MEKIHLQPEMGGVVKQLQSELHLALQMAGLALVWSGLATGAERQLEAAPETGPVQVWLPREDVAPGSLPPEESA